MKKLLLLTLLLPGFLFSQNVFGQTKEEVYEYLVSIDCKFPEIVTAQSIFFECANV